MARHSKLGRTQTQVPTQRDPITIVEYVRTCRPCASITFASLSSVTSASRSTTFTNAFDPASSAPAQVQVECYQTLMQSPDIPLERVCLLIPRLLASHSLRRWFLFEVRLRPIFLILPLPFLPLIWLA